ncbi:MAG: hypothetical protein ACK4GT_10245, partial [Pararhodobacter sp.]
GAPGSGVREAKHAQAGPAGQPWEYKAARFRSVTFLRQQPRDTPTHARADPPANPPANTPANTPADTLADTLREHLQIAIARWS